MDAHQIPAWIKSAIYQVFELERKIQKLDKAGNLRRNIDKLKDAFEDAGYVYEDPMGQSFTETRTDLEVSIVGSGLDDLIVVEVIKPIILYVRTDGPLRDTAVVQPGVAIVESRKESNS